MSKYTSEKWERWKVENNLPKTVPESAKRQMRHKPYQKEENDESIQRIQQRHDL